MVKQIAMPLIIQYKTQSRTVPHRCALLGAVLDDFLPSQRTPSPCFSAVGQEGMETKALLMAPQKDTSQGTVI